MNRLALAFIILFFSISHAAESVPWPVKPAKSFFKTVDYYIEITTPEEFALMVESATDSSMAGKYFILMTDIVINEGDASTWGVTPPKYKWLPVGDSVNPARINFNGNNHIISGLYMNSEDDFQGLFGFLDGEINNLYIVNSFIKGERFVGAAAGATTGRVRDIFVDAIVEGSRYVGGVVGFPGYTYGRSSVGNCIFKGSVKGTVDVGGIFGRGEVSYEHGGGASRCDNYGSVHGEENVGGILGAYSIDVPKSGSYLKYNRNYGTISGKSYVGGIAGSFGISRDDDSKLTYNIGFLRNMGEVIGRSYVGGLMGGYAGGNRFNQYTVESSYNAGRVSGKWSTVGLYRVTDDQDSCIRCFNFAEIYEDGILIEDRMKPSEIHKYADSLGPDFVPDSGIVMINGGYPILVEELEAFESRMDNREDGNRANKIVTSAVPKPQREISSDFTVASANRNIVLQGELLDKGVAVFDVRGSRVWSGQAQAKTLSIPIAEPGIYIVRCGARTVKTLVR